MPISSNSLISIIKQNKNKKLAASKIIETNPKLLPVFPKLIQSNTTTLDINGKLSSNINKDVLVNLYNRIKSTYTNNKNIAKLFPDIELAIQILVSAILSPKKMTDIQLSYKFNKNVSLNANVSSKIISTIKEYIDTNYSLEDKLPDILRESLFESGAYVQVIIPEASVDNLISSDLLSTYSTEDFKSKVDVLIDRLVKPINIPNISSEEISTITTPEQLVSAMVSSSSIRMTDNVGILNYSSLKSKVHSNIMRSSMKKGTSISQESRERIEYVDIFRKSSNTTHTPLVSIKTKTEAHRKSIGKPMIVKISTEAIIPVVTPGNKAEHIAYLLLLDENGKPLTASAADSSLNQIKDVESSSYCSTNTSDSSIQKAYRNLVYDSTENIDVNTLFNMYSNILERQIYDNIKGSLYGSDAELISKNDIYFIMFARALANQRTNILFIPKDLVVYWAFQYNEIGIGKTLLENLTVLSNLRAILLFSRVMAMTKQAIDVTKVNISLDPNDPDPEKTIEQIQDSVLRLRQNFMPLGVGMNPVDLVNWIQRAGLQFAYENNPLIPDVKIDFENGGVSHTVPDTELDESLRKQTIIAMGLSPETVDNGFNPEFATSVVNNNILLSKRVALYQKSLSKHLHKFVDTVYYNDEDARKEIADIILESKEIILETLTEEEKQLLSKDEEAFIDYYISLLTESLEISPPKPESSNISNLAVEYDIYKENLDKVLDSVISEEILPANLAGEINTHIESIKLTYKNYLLRNWMANNNFYPEALEVTSDTDEDMDGIVSSVTNYIATTSKNGVKLLKLMSKYRQAVDKNLQSINTEGSDTSQVTEESSSSEESSDDSFSLDF